MRSAPTSTTCAGVQWGERITLVGMRGGAVDGEKAHLLSLHWSVTAPRRRPIAQHVERSGARKTLGPRKPLHRDFVDDNPNKGE